MSSAYVAPAGPRAYPPCPCPTRLRRARRPLPQWLRWQGVRKQVVRRLVHPPAQTRGAETTTGAGEGDQTRQAAIFARQVREASLHDATVEVPRELGAHKFRQSGLPPFLDSRIERRQVFSHHPMQRLGKRIVLLVDPWPPPHSGGDVGQSLSAIRAACHRLPLSVRAARCCLSPVPSGRGPARWCAGRPLAVSAVQRRIDVLESRRRSGVASSAHRALSDSAFTIA
jgi:hypothetical protein